ncbi:MAG TPA: adenylate/guanylate cyclase domain-containing protein [Gaiellaceae bacterium]|nr:adenylate/guanylate cyclase domain-containing protein [Gaiellaceae bacterium]
MAEIAEPLVAARAAASRHAWREAYEAYSKADKAELAAEDMERYADAAWWSGKLEQAISLRERAYAACAGAGRQEAAARLALMLVWDHVGRGAFAVGQGWLASAERQLAETPETREHGLLALTRAVIALQAGAELSGTIAEFERAHELGLRSGDRETQVLALAGKGRALVQAGEVEQGLALQDEAAAVCGALSPFATGLVYCLTISTSQAVGDFRRAAEWSEIAKRWCNQLDVTGFPGACRIHHAEVMRVRGEWAQAEQQALAACEELHDFDRSITASGYYEVGEIRRRRGDLEGAEEAYRKANEWGQVPQPGLALLRLAEGKVEVALAGISRALADVEDPLMRLRLLPARVEIAVAAGDLAGARAAADELERLVQAFRIGASPAPAFEASVHLARGQILLTERDWAEAARRFSRARDRWQEVGAPYEIARARLLLGIALRRQGDEQGAALELDGALAAFERLGAVPDAVRAQELLGRLAPRRTFLFTDIVGSTRLLEALGEDRWRKLLARHDELVRERIAENGGEVVKKTGDGFFASFATPRAAVEAAVAIQRALAGELVAPDVRIGVHAGEAFRTGEAEEDYGGQGVHAAARIGAEAGAGEILASRETLDGIALPYRTPDRGRAELKGFAEPVALVAVDWR